MGTPGIGQPGYDPENPPAFSWNPLPFKVTPEGEGRSPFNEATGVNQTPPAPKALVEPGALPVVPPGTEGSDAFADGARANSEYDATVYGWMKPTGPSAEVTPEAVDWNPAGPEGKKDFKSAFVEGPQKVKQALAEGQVAEAARDKALAEHYTNEMAREQSAQASIAARRQQDDEQQSRRQADLDSTITRYSNDLADQGKFFQNPGNIISAIAFSLMPIGGGDPAMGAKLIQNAINQDMANRQKTADMHLGELRSNLSEYRKAAGDRRIGDMLAESEAQRVAALEVQRIGASFASPIAKAKTEALTQDFLMRSQQKKMEAFQAYHLYMAPKAMPPGIVAAYKNAGPGGMTAFNKMNGDMDVGPGAIKGTMPLQGVPAGSATTARGPSGPLGPTGPDGNPGPTTQPKPKTFTISDIMKSRGLSDAASLMKQQAADVQNEAAALAKPGDPHSYNEQVAKIKLRDEEDQKKIAELAQKVLPDVHGSRRMAHDIALINSECQQAGVNPQDFIGELRAGTSGPLGSKIRTMQLALTRANPDNKHEVKQRELLEASERFHQLFAGEVVEYYHTKFGSAQNPSESAKGAQVITTSSSWPQIVNWNNLRSQDAQAGYTSALASAGNPRAATKFQISIGIGTPALARQGATPVPGGNR